jgi:hypothetical protein
MLSQVSALPSTFAFDLPELTTGLSHSEKNNFRRGPHLRKNNVGIKISYICANMGEYAHQGVFSQS